MRALLGSAFLGFVLMAAAGCSSMHATSVQGGVPRASGDGFPIVLQRPRYLRVTEKQVVDRVVVSSRPSSVGDGGGDTIVTPGSAQPAPRASTATPTAVVEAKDYSSREISYEIVPVSEVFLVDIKRPAAGTAEFAIEFEAGQSYPKRVAAKTEDKTIEAAGSAVGSMLEKVSKAFKPTSDDKPLPPLPSGASTVRVASTVVHVWLYDMDRLGEPGYLPLQLYPTPSAPAEKKQ